MISILIDFLQYCHSHIFKFINVTSSSLNWTRLVCFLIDLIHISVQNLIFSHWQLLHLRSQYIVLFPSSLMLLQSWSPRAAQCHGKSNEVWWTYSCRHCATRWHCFSFTRGFILRILLSTDILAVPFTVFIFHAQNNIAFALFIYTGSCYICTYTIIFTGLDKVL